MKDTTPATTTLPQYTVGFSHLISGHLIYIVTIGALLLSLGFISWKTSSVSPKRDAIHATLESSPNDIKAPGPGQSGPQNLRERRRVRLHGASSASSAFAPTNSTSTPATSSLVINPGPTNPGSSRGTSKSISSSPLHNLLFPPTPPASTHTLNTHVNTSTIAPTNHRGKRRAVCIGFNYRQPGKPEAPSKMVNPLNHSVADARLFASKLYKLGYLEEDIKVITDEDTSSPSPEDLLESMNWLIRDVSAGDRLLLMFSGHCVSPGFKTGGAGMETYLVAANMMPLRRSTLYEHLIAKVPVGAELILVLDCCNAAGMVNLKHCIKRMGDNCGVKQISSFEALSQLEQSTVFPQSGSLNGMPAVAQLAPMRVAPVNTVNVNIPLSGSPSVRRPGGSVAAAPIIVSGTTIQPPMSINPRPGRQAVAEGAPIAPAGKVVLWAGTGNHQKAFESSNGVQSSVVTSAICSALDALDGDNVTQSALWKSLVGAIDEENSRRQERDSKKAKRPAPNLRVQHAQIWSSQEVVDTPSTPNNDPFVPWRSEA
ncbi:unnamed protein product [Rhizoctonia solani]|uniref:Peptidase C14 caspase domain-containing protein n=1 Tax=Rhizoctonia solani TaxID=456999 RepID=A0A8H3A0V9_9AGAM|nr:unnamed protein product [Rhizoctonia solani]